MSETSVEEKKLGFGDYEWNDYVLSHLKDDEKIDDHPKTDALRRLVEKLIGIIVDTKTTIIQAPNHDNLNKAVVIVTITLSPYENSKQNFRYTYSGSADSDVRNTDPPYNSFTTAIAETRALARAYRQALRIRVCSAEELSENANAAVDTIDTDIKITDIQIKGIDTSCKNLNINVEKLINAGELKYNTINEVSRNKGTLILKTLTEFKNGSKKIPESLLGYSKGWQESFTK